VFLLLAVPGRTYNTAVPPQFSAALCTYAGTVGGMGEAKHKHRPVRFSDQDWADLGAGAGEIGSDRSAVLRQLAAWWLGRPGARPPRRPTPRNERT